MNKEGTLVILLFAAVTLSVSAKRDTLKYRISLTDKIETTYSLQRPEEFLSGKAIARRARQRLAIDSTDLPVCDTYVRTIRDKGVKVIAKGKWDNFVTVSCNDTIKINRIAELPFVRSVEKVWTAPKRDKKKEGPERDSIVSEPYKLENPYGLAYMQLYLSHGDRLHKAGYRGEGMTIAIMDAGFHNADRIAAFDSVRIIGTKDLVGDSPSIYAESDHGMKVLSCMGANWPHAIVGSAPEASYWLFRTEDEYSEHLVEQDYWAVAIEYADSVGVDVVNTSLGYFSFDDKSKDYRLRDLNGECALISRQASRVAGKGMVLLCSAGNSGQGSWKKITPPGDAKNVLTVGAISNSGTLATFSSVGNSADGRVKPDIVAVGVSTQVIGTDGQPTTASGTSFATPVMCGMVACLWQARPELTAKQIITLVRRSGDRADFPDNVYGYGVPDLWKACQMQGDIPESAD
ncbi:MAG: S8 family serine peptidase [Mediterranea sp.]|jgi:subtilisin family serine protease|nr:S8 family serine peptidase [Mediterranea sp.]